MKSEVVHVRLSELYMWKLRNEADYRGYTAGRYARQVLEQALGAPTDDEVQRFRSILIRAGRADATMDSVSLEVQRMRQRNLRRGRAPSRAEIEARGKAEELGPTPELPQEPEPIQVGNLPCPDCESTVKIDPRTAKRIPAIDIYDSSTGEWACGVCGHTGDNPAFIGQPVTVEPPERTTYWDEDAGILRYDDDDSPVKT